MIRKLKINCDSSGRRNIIVPSLYLFPPRICLSYNSNYSLKPHFNYKGQFSHVQGTPCHNITDPALTTKACLIHNHGTTTTRYFKRERGNRGDGKSYSKDKELGVAIFPYIGVYGNSGNDSKTFVSGNPGNREIREIEITFSYSFFTRNLSTDY